MGEPKGLVRVEGRPWLEHQLAAVSPRRVVVVLGEHREQYEAAMPDLARRATLVTNPAPERGPFSSLQVGLAAVPPDEAVFVLPVDVPAASAPVWAALEAGLGAGAGAEAAQPVFEGRGGHPVLLGPGFAALLRALPPTARLDEQLRKLASLAGLARVARVPVSDGRVRLNLNAPEDWGKVARGG